MSWDEQRNELLGDVIGLLADLDKGRIKHVSTDINYIYVHFFNEKDEDIGSLFLACALDALWNDIYLWPEAGPEIAEGFFPDMDMRDAVRVELQTH